MADISGFIGVDGNHCDTYGPTAQTDQIELPSMQYVAHLEHWGSTVLMSP